MKRCFIKLIIVLFVLSATNIRSEQVSFETGIKLNWGKRFIDQFDRRLPELRWSAADLSTSYELRNVTWFRNSGSAELYFLFSPVFRHYIGFDFAYTTMLDSGAITQKSATSERTTTITYSAMTPGILYKYYPRATTPDDLNLYIGTGIGFNMASIKMSNSSAEAVNFTRVRGPRFKAFLGNQFYFIWGMNWFIEGGFEVAQLGDFEGTLNSSTETDTSVSLKYSKSSMAIIRQTEESQFTDFDTDKMWINQIYIATGISFRF